MAYEVVREISPPKGDIIRDVAIRLKGYGSSQEYPEEIRLIEAWVEVKNVRVRMIFMTNNFEWSADSICKIYKSRWSIEVFFFTDKTESADIRLFR